MRLVDILSLLTGSAAPLLSFLRDVGARFPDLQPTAHNLIEQLQEAVSQERLVELATMLPKEIADIARGKIEPRDHPSDSI